MIFIAREEMEVFNKLKPDQFTPEGKFNFTYTVIYV